VEQADHDNLLLLRCRLRPHRNTALEGTKRAINIEGDPDHPINEGALCPKGGSIYQLTEGTPGQPNPRLQKVMYRKPYGTKWEEKSWDWALERIAKNIKRDRDATFALKNAKGQTVNRCEGLASVGSAAFDSEECWAYQAFLRSLGLTFIEHQARICHSASVAALAETFGRGAMTNHWIDIKNSDCILIMGSNAARPIPSPSSGSPAPRRREPPSSTWTRASPAPAQRRTFTPLCAPARTSPSWAA
jgi:formate dehydrogenase major subunit